MNFSNIDHYQDIYDQIWSVYTIQLNDVQGESYDLCFNIVYARFGDKGLQECIVCLIRKVGEVTPTHVGIAVQHPNEENLGEDREGVRIAFKRAVREVSRVRNDVSFKELYSHFRLALRFEHATGVIKEGLQNMVMPLTV